MASPSILPYGTIADSGARVNGIVGEDQPLLAPGPKPQSWWRRRFVIDARRDWADIMLLGCYIITGILDSASISTWGAFVSMQTGKLVRIRLIFFSLC
ncbi:hypothetical protein ACJ41O_010422 [Fusarium nematophilum]